MTPPSVNLVGLVKCSQSTRESQGWSLADLRHYQIVSLWDMLRVYAETFMLLTKHLGEMADEVKELPRDPISDEPTRRSWKKVGEVVNSVLDEIAKHCKSLHLEFSLAQIERIRCLSDAETFVSDVGTTVAELVNRVEDELKERAFFFVAPERARYLQEDPPPFGKGVHESFPELNGDILDASRCLGVGLPTGAVFYLMRVTEFGILRLAKRLKVQKNKVKHKTWDAILKEMNNAIDALTKSPSLSPKKRAWRDRCAYATGHLNNVRIAWRNPVMHAERTYTQEEAQEIFGNVRVFTNYLAENVF